MKNEIVVDCDSCLGFGQIPNSGECPVCHGQGKVATEPITGDISVMDEIGIEEIDLSILG